MAVSEQEQVSIGSNGRGQPHVNGRPPLPTDDYLLPDGGVPFQVYGRYRRILLFFGGVILQIIWWDLLLARMPGIGDWVRARRSQRIRRSSRRFRALALEMGGVMIKLGQFLSSRVDVLPVEVTEELRGLQDEVPAEPTWRMMAVLHAELPDADRRFARIEEMPLAAASLGQAHRAWLHATVEPIPVVIKIQRPDIEEIVRTDLGALKVVARLIMRYKPIRRRANVPALLDEFARTLWEELDYVLEADNVERFNELYADSERVYIPAVYRQHSTRRVIVLENVEGIKITDVAGMEAVGVDPKEVAEILLDSYFHQIFQEGFFHADPHPGNLFVRPRTDLPWAVSANGDTPPQLARPFWLTFVDFGMVGRVPDLMGENLRQVLISVLQKDGRALTQAYARLGFFLPGADLDRIAEAQTVVLERIWGRSLLELTRPDPKEIQEIGQEFRDLLFEFPIQVPQDFIYLGRAIGMVSGLVSQLDEEINPWNYFEKYGEALIREQQAQQWTWEAAWGLVRPYLSTPSRVQRLLTMAERGQIRVQTDREMLKRYDKIEKRLGQLGWSIIGAASILSATLLFLNRKKDPKE
ncbi:MAG: AarF/ABC1/UbiB kinase family protein [Anaerolineae bacterium]|nr:AarF/ABC1/UbiB kinase family protein [Anaerolineae bacterium]